MMITLVLLAAGQLDAGQPFETVVHSTPPSDGSFKLRALDAHEIPGTQGDPLHSVMALPGVSNLFSGLAYPLVRGSSPAATPTFFDGVRLPHLFHAFLGPAVIHPRLIEAVDFSPSGISVAHGLLLGGTVEARVAHVDHLVAEAAADLLSASAVAIVPSPNTGTTLSLAGRYSYAQGVFALTEKLLTPGSLNIANFWDYQARLEQRFLTGTLRLLALGASDVSGAQTTLPGLAEPSINTDSVAFHRVDARFVLPVGPGQLELGATVGTDELGTSTTSQATVLGPLGLQLVSATRSTVVRQQNQAARLSWAAQPDANWSVRTGLTVERVQGSWQQDFSSPSSKDTSTVTHPTSVGIWLGAWVEGSWRPVDWLTATGGVRLDHFRKVGGGTATSADPRLSLQARLSDTLSVHAAAGQYHQAPSLLLSAPVISLSADEQGLQEVWQFSTGVNARVCSWLSLSIDAYVNPMPRLVEFALVDDERPQPMGGFGPTDLGPPKVSHGLSFGGELMLRLVRTEHFYGWVTASAQRSTRVESYRLVDGAFLGEQTASGLLPYAFDQSLVSNLVLGYRFGGGYSVGVLLHFNTGRPESGTLTSRTNVSSSDGSSWLPLSRDQVQRLPAYLRLDVRASKRWQPAWGFIELAVDVYNADFQPEVNGYAYLGGAGVPLQKVAYANNFFVPTVSLKAGLD